MPRRRRRGLALLAAFTLLVASVRQAYVQAIAALVFSKTAGHRGDGADPQRMEQFHFGLFLAPFRGYPPSFAVSVPSGAGAFDQVGGTS